ncbi:putative microfibril-associated protein [Rosellinia necatrix]|uniref:Putative microfibril-associated protein n=1 Tax=Rosellinia necatrix TaxID=77044 RepID=A0A1W2TLC3_ROSNE|nr:putative microfibril-associated protein [Rosellinia necatrix]
MAKGTISKKKKAPSLHSRAARRATSPGIDTDKSLKNVQPPPESVDHRPSVLAIHHAAGISKRQKKGRALSSKARKRHEKAQDRAAAILERTEKKVVLSKDQSRTLQSRRRAWDEINQQIPPNKSKTESRVITPRDEDSTEEVSDFDDAVAEMEDERESQQDDADPAGVMKSTTENTAMGQDDDDDGIL